MSLVDYEDSSSESADSSEPECKKVKCTESGDTTDDSNKICLPKAILQIGLPARKADDEYVEDPSLHGGRTRTFKHERGNWASYIYIPIEKDMWEEVQEICQAELSGICEMQLPTDDLHISLSKTMVLQYHLIEPLAKSLDAQLSHLEMFSICFENLKVYTNEQRSRTFLALQVNDICFEFLYRIMQKVDVVMNEFRLPVFYENPSFHMSFLWCVGDQVNLINERLNTIAIRLKEKVNLSNEIIRVNKICLISGFKQFTFNLNKLQTF